MDVPPPAVDPEILTRNLAALQPVAPDLAGTLSAPAPDEERYSPALARDGVTTFREIRDGAPGAWFGRSSIPQTRALALLDQFNAGNGNILLPGMAAGIEAKLLCERLGPHRAIFLWEPSVLAVRLALRVHDYADAIARERLILLIRPLETLGEAFVDWLRGHPGHLPPERLMMYPWQSWAELSAIRSVIEGVHRDVETHRSAALAAGGKVGIATGGLERPRIAILSLHAHELNWATADALATAAGALDGSATVLDIRSPGDMHPLARAEHLRNARDLHAAILLDISRNDVGELLPAELPVVSWVSGHVPSTQVGVRDALAVPNARAAEQAAAAGVPKDQIILCPAPCLAPTDTAAHRDRDIDIAVFADLTATDPAAFGHTLETHAQVWNAAIELLKADLDIFTEARVSDALSTAERKLKARIDEASIRRGMITALTQCVAPTLLWQKLLAEMAYHRLNVQVWGCGWPEDAPFKPAGTAGWAERLTACRRAKVVVHLDPSGLATTQALLAAGSGAVLLARAEPQDKQPGGLATLLEPGKEMLTFTYGRELISQARRLLSDTAYRTLIATRAVARCRAEHSPSARLQALLSALPKRPPVTGT